MVETGFPNSAELLNPFVNFLHFVYFEEVINFAAFVVLFNQFTFYQNAHMFGNTCLVVSKCAARASGVIACRAIKVIIALLVGSAIACKISLPIFFDVIFTCETDRLQIYVQPFGFANIFKKN